MLTFIFLHVQVLIESSWEQLDSPSHPGALFAFHTTLEEFLSRFLERSAGSELADLPPARADEQHLIRAQRASRKHSSHMQLSQEVCSMLFINYN